MIWPMAFPPGAYFCTSCGEPIDFPRRPVLRFDGDGRLISARHRECPVLRQPKGRTT